MSDDYEHLPVTPDQLRDALYEAHGGPPSDAAVAAAVEALRDRDADGDAGTAHGSHAAPIEALDELEDCPVCGAPVGRGGVPAHIVAEHAD